MRNVFASLVVLFFGLIYLGMGSGVFPAKFTEGKEGGPAFYVIMLVIGIGYCITAMIGFFSKNKEANMKTGTKLSIFLGLFGADRLYYHYYFTGMLKAISLGGFFFWWLLDMGRIAGGHLVWKEENERREAAAIRKEARYLTPNAVSAMGRPSASSSGTKTIIKDAVKGGIIAGEAGAVVGAVVGKNKVDHEKK